MTPLIHRVQLTLRGMHGLFVPLAIWGLATVVCTIAGPFGTHEALGLGGRLIYWAAVVGLSVLGSVLVSRAARGRSTGIRLLLWLCFVPVLSLVIWGLNGQLFEGWTRLALLGRLTVDVGLVVFAVQAVFALIDFVRPERAAPVPDAESRFLRRLPVANRGPLVRIEAQDHYLKVVTERGAPLILMRLSEAVDALGENLGVQVHRSHWVARKAVRGHRRENGRDLLLMVDGAEVPVSRGNRAAAQDAGLF